MDSKICDSRFSVFLRILGDESMSQYECCIDVIGKTAVSIHNATGPPGTAFSRKDRIGYSPQQCNFASTACPFEPVSPAHHRSLSPVSSVKRSKSTPASQSKELTFEFDCVFDDKDSAEIFAIHLIGDLANSQTLVSLGKSDALNEAVPLYLIKAFKEGWRVKLQIVTLTGHKLVNYLEAEEVELETLDQALELIRNCEGLNRRKSGDSIVVVTMSFESDADTTSVQVIDIPFPNKSTELMFRVLVNSDMPQDAINMEFDKLLRLVKKSLAANAVVKVLGNVLPTGPHFAAARGVIKTLEHLMQRRHRCQTLQSKILSDQLARLKRIHQREKEGWARERGINEEMHQRYLGQIKKLEIEKVQLNLLIDEGQRLQKDAQIDSNFTTLLKQKDAEICDLKQQLKAVPKHDLPTLPVDRQQAVKDPRVIELDRQLDQEQLGSARRLSVSSRSLRKLTCTKNVGALTINSGKNDRSFVVEMLKESWRYTDDLMKQKQIDYSHAKLFSEAKTAVLHSRYLRSVNESTIYKKLFTDLTVENEALITSRTSLEKELESLRDVHSKREEKVRADFKMLKDNARAKIFKKKERFKALTHENAELRKHISDSGDLHNRIQELLGQVQSWQFTASRHKDECEAAVKENKRLEEQIAQLRELRKPLKPR